MFVGLRVVYLLKTDSGYPKDAGETGELWRWGFSLRHGISVESLVNCVPEIVQSWYASRPSPWVHVQD